MPATARASHRNPRHSSHASARRDRRNQRERCTPQLVLIACTQRIIDTMEEGNAQKGKGEQVRPTHVRIEGEDYFNAYLVTMDEAREWCQRCRRQLCRCGDKFQAPFMLAWKVRRKGKRVVLLRRQEMPIRIPPRRKKAKAA